MVQSPYDHPQLPRLVRKHFSSANDSKVLCTNLKWILMPTNNAFRSEYRRGWVLSISIRCLMRINLITLFILNLKLFLMKDIKKKKDQ